MNERIDHDLIDTRYIAKMLGVTRAWTTASITKQPDFPKPKVNLSQRMRRWSQREIVQWMTKSR